MSKDAVEALYRTLLERWNGCDAEGYGDLFADDGSMVGFDGSCMQSARAIREHLGSIFADHRPATYVARVEEVRSLGAGSALLRAFAGMVPPGGSDIMPDKNAAQVLIAVETVEGWRIAHFQNTPAKFDGRPDEAERLTADLQAQLAAR